MTGRVQEGLVKSRGKHGRRMQRHGAGTVHVHRRVSGVGQLNLDLHKELIVDCFCGGGGASHGILMGLGRHVDVAVNHSAKAISLHEANHPTARHYPDSVWAVDPQRVTEGRPVGLLWLSPDCTHHSRAKGGKPVSKGIRSLAWVALRWAGTTGATRIVLENVPELQGWCGLVAKRDPATGRVMRVDGSVAAPGEVTPLKQQQLVPDPRNRGKNFKRLVNALKDMGYEVEFKELTASDYGVPTTRRRLFLIARNDGRPIVWPEITHGDPKSLKVKAKRLKPWKSAAECMDFTIPCASVFLTKEEGRALGVRRPLAEATMRRVGSAVARYIVNAESPFVVSEGGEVVKGYGLATVGYGERSGQRPRALDVTAPLGTVVAGGTKHALVCASMVKHYGGVVGFALNDEPMHTVTAKDHHAVVMAGLERVEASAIVKMRGTNIGHAADEPIHTISAQGNHFAEVRALLQACGSEGVDGDGCLVKWKGCLYRIVDIGMRMLRPRELFKAMGFPDDYIIGDGMGPGPALTLEEQVRMVGNSVPPPLVSAIVAGNCGDMAVRKAA